LSGQSFHPVWRASTICGTASGFSADLRFGRLRANRAQLIHKRRGQLINEARLGAEQLYIDNATARATATGEGLVMTRMKWHGASSHRWTPTTKHRDARIALPPWLGE
jgi:hypothetical protein